MKRIASVVFGSTFFVLACSAPKPEVPPLTPQTAAALLQFDNKAHSWIQFVKGKNPGCEYRLDLPDQANHPNEIDLDHIVSCGGRPAPKEYDASVVFAYDSAAQRWTVSRFAS